MKRVLVVDNEPDFGYFVKKNLEAVGEFEVFVCSDSRRAIDDMKNLMPDVVIMDVLMPGLPGPEVAQRMRKTKETRHIPVIFLTVTTPRTLDEEAARVEGCPALSKPVEISELVEAIKEAA